MSENNNETYFVSQQELQKFEDHQLLKSTMSTSGVMNKVMQGLLVALLGAVVGAVWPSYALCIAAGFLATISSLVCRFSPHLAPRFIWPYTFCTGVTLGTVSLLVEAVFPGIVSQAVAGTALTFVVVLMGQRSGLMRTTPRSRKIIAYICISFILLKLCTAMYTMIGHYAGFLKQPGTLYTVLFGLGGKGPIGLMSIFVSLFAIGLGCFLLVINLEMISEGVHNYKLPKEAEWYFAYSLLACVFYIYIEILKLLIKSRMRERES